MRFNQIMSLIDQIVNICLDISKLTSNESNSEGSGKNTKNMNIGNFN